MSMFSFIGHVLTKLFGKTGNWRKYISKRGQFFIHRRKRFSKITCWKENTHCGKCSCSKFSWSAFSGNPNVEKYGPEKFWIQTLLTQWLSWRRVHLYECIRNSCLISFQFFLKICSLKWEKLRIIDKEFLIML